MPIVVSHSAGPAAVGAAAYTGGRGRRQEREQRASESLRLSYDQLNAEQQARAASQANQMERFYAGLADRQRQDLFDLQQAREHRGWQSSERAAASEDRFALESMRMEQDRQLQEQENRERAMMQRREQVSRAVQDGMAFYTPEQRSRLSKLQNELGRLHANSRLSPEQKQDAARQLQMSIDDIMVNPQWRSPDNKPVPIDQQVKQKLYYDDNGTPWTVDDKGNVQVPRGWKEPQQPETQEPPRIAPAEAFKFRLEINDRIADYAKDLMLQSDAEGNPKYSADQAWGMARQQYQGLLDEVEGRRQPGQGQQGGMQPPTQGRPTGQPQQPPRQQVPPQQAQAARRDFEAGMQELQGGKFAGTPEKKRAYEELLKLRFAVQSGVMPMSPSLRETLQALAQQVK